MQWNAGGLTSWQNPLLRQGSGLTENETVDIDYEKILAILEIKEV